MTSLDDFLKESERRLEAIKKIRPDGSWDVNANYQEILKLHEMLEEHEIPHDMFRHFDGWVIHYPAGFPDCVCSCIQHCTSYGAFLNKLEIRGLLTPDKGDPGDVLGYLTAEDVFSRIKAHFDENTEV